MSLSAQQCSVCLGRRSLIKGLSLEVVPGQVHALMGPNGAGKTSLLRLMAGEVDAPEGQVMLDGQLLKALAPVKLARRRAVLNQLDLLNFGLLVGEVVALGRVPHEDSRAQNVQVVSLALKAVDLASLSGRNYLSLSGGERMRVRLARALAQVWEQFDSPAPGAARYLLLDEPAAYLDPGHQHSCLQLIRRFADLGGGVLAILHDPNLAMAYADTVSLIRDGALIASGPTNSTLQRGPLEETFGVAAERIDLAGRRPFIVFGDSVPIARSR